jgi:ribosomal protein S18 acetylase RimI-like enzyme
MRVRESHDPADLRALQRSVARSWSPRSRWHVGGLAWSLRQHADPGSAIRIWEEDGEVLAWGWLRPPGDLDPFVDPARAELLHDVVDGFEEMSTADELRVTVVGRAPLLQERGYRPVPDTDPFFLHLARDLRDLPEPILPEGYRIRSVRGERDLPERVGVHRAAFDPSRLTQDHYRAVTASWPYRGDLDRVVEAPDGSLAAFCLAWLDPENRSGELEPVGTHPDHRRRGLGRAVCIDACSRLREAGADVAIVCARGDDAYPIPRQLYGAIGFREVARNVTYVRRLG